MIRRPLSDNQRRSRAALRWTIGLFVLIQLAGGLLLDWRGLAIRFPSAAQALDRLEQSEEPPDIICLGSSRFMHGLPVEDWQGAMDRQLPRGRAVHVFNAAVPAGDQISSEMMLDQLLRHGVRPRLAVIEVTPESLNHFNTWLSTHVQRQLSWSELPRYFADICYARQIVPLLKGRLLPLFVHRKQICQEGVAEADELLGHRLFPHEESESDSGTADESPGSALDRTRVGMAQVHRWLQHYTVGGTAAAALDRTLNRCRENGIRIVLVRPPVIREHREAYTPEIESSFLAHVQHLAAEYGCPFADYSARLPDSLFLDNHHLLAEGGRQFSDLLASEVLAPEMGQ